MLPFDALVLPATGYWQKKEAQVARYYFGKGATKEFSWYFEGDTKVQVKSVKEICRWLAKCQYVSDEEMFMEDDFWQHPVTFERTRQGDCEDHALWAWRKLSELGIPAEFVCGQWLEEIDGVMTEGGHAWVNLKPPGTNKWQVMECTYKDPKKMIISLEDAEKTYFPEVSICSAFKTYRFDVNTVRRKRNQPRA